MNEYKISRWTKGNMDRLYINGGLLGFGEKVYLEADRDGTVKAHGFSHTRIAAGVFGNNSDAAYEIAERALTERGIEWNLLKTTFADLLTKVEV